MFLKNLYAYLSTKFSNVTTMVSNVEHRVGHVHERTTLLRDNVARVEERVVKLTILVEDMAKAVNVTNEVWTPPPAEAPDVASPSVEERLAGLEKQMILLAQNLRDAVSANSKGFQGVEAHVEDTSDLFDAVEEDVIELFAASNDVKAALALSTLTINALHARLRQLEEALEVDPDAATPTEPELVANASLMKAAIDTSNKAAQYRSAPNALVASIREAFGDEGVAAFVAAGGELDGSTHDDGADALQAFIETMADTFADTDEDGAETADEDGAEDDDGPFPIAVDMARRGTPESKETLIEDLVGMLMQARASEYIDDAQLAQAVALLTGDHGDYEKEFSADVRTNLTVIGEVEKMFDGNGDESITLMLYTPIDVISMVWAVFVNECLRNDW